MARTKNEKAAKELGQSLTRLRKKKHDPSYSTIERELMPWLQSSTPVSETLRGYHDGRVDPAAVHIDVAVALANYYNVTVQTLHESFGPRYTRGRALLFIPDDEWTARDSNPEPTGQDLASDQRGQIERSEPLSVAAA